MEVDVPVNASGLYSSVTPNKTSYDPDPSSLWPVEPEVYGEGLPYAPENWPNPGDIWAWRTGRRIATTGFFKDRYLYAPHRFSLIDASGSSRKRHIFPSRFAVERYIRETFPDADVNAFFDSFSWRIPAASTSREQRAVVAVPLKTAVVDADQSASDSQPGIVGCKVGNKMCNSLTSEEIEKYLPAMPCDVCCAEPSFCRDCTCILCCKSVDSAHGGYSYIKCPAKVENETICGHVAHMDCALRAQLAGTVGGSIELDAKYYCRRCDMILDLIPFVCELTQTSEAINSRDDIKKMLNLGAQILRGSQQTTAKELLLRIELAISKYDQLDSIRQLSRGACLEDIWKEDDDLAARSVGISDDQKASMENVVSGNLTDVKIGVVSYECLSASLKFEHDVEQVLQDLEKSQESEYQLAEERLELQRNNLLSLYEQLDAEKTILAHQNPSRRAVLPSATSEREKQIEREVKKFKEMTKVAKGFGRTSRRILKEHFGLDIAD